MLCSRVVTTGTRHTLKRMLSYRTFTFLHQESFLAALPCQYLHIVTTGTNLRLPRSINLYLSNFGHTAVKWRLKHVWDYTLRNSHFVVIWDLVLAWSWLIPDMMQWGDTTWLSECVVAFSILGWLSLVRERTDVFGGQHTQAFSRKNGWSLTLYTESH